jgi:hypothetical protein
MTIASYHDDLFRTEFSRKSIEEGKLGVQGDEPLSVLTQRLRWGVRSVEIAPGKYKPFETPQWKPMKDLTRQHLWNIWCHVPSPRNLTCATRRAIINLIIEKSDVNERLTHSHPLVRAGVPISDEEPVDSEIELQGV